MSSEHRPIGDADLEDEADRASRNPTRREKPSGTNSMELIIFAAFIGLWFALQLWILPKFGVST